MSAMHVCCHTCVALVSQDFIAVVMLMAWLVPTDEKPMPFTGTNFDIIELYAGRARVTRLARSVGLNAIASDKVYDENSRSSLQLNNAAGFGQLGTYL